ncbi:hypothetical protein RIR_jg29699.t1 [Rhizophagus irregularis DAOM 181602=DAOM 197198]|nr:hypothetical protein RIR_jg29699.t1 [Rhizophagus irregularis DAOM 181602=DAOM 197198]
MLKLSIYKREIGLREMNMEKEEFSALRQNLNYDGLRRFRISFILFGLIFTTEAFGIIANNCDQAVKVAAFVGIYISFGYLPLRKNESVITEQDRSTKYCGTKEFFDLRPYFSFHYYPVILLIYKELPKKNGLVFTFEKQGNSSNKWDLFEILSTYDKIR